MIQILHSQLLYVVTIELKKINKLKKKFGVT